MAKYYTETHSHPFSWQQVAEAIFQRYPNPFSTHVLSEDTMHRAVIGNVLYTRRFLTKTNKLPSWGEKYLARFKKMVPLVEESTVDREKKIITTYTRNVGLSMFMTAVEKVSYREHPNDPNVTIAVKEAWFESGLYGLRWVRRRLLVKWDWYVSVTRSLTARDAFAGLLSRASAWRGSNKTANEPRMASIMCFIGYTASSSI